MINCRSILCFHLDFDRRLVSSDFNYPHLWRVQNDVFRFHHESSAIGSLFEVARRSESCFSQSRALFDVSEH